MASWLVCGEPLQWWQATGLSKQIGQSTLPLALCSQYWQRISMITMFVHTTSQLGPILAIHQSASLTPSGLGHRLYVSPKNMRVYCSVPPKCPIPVSAHVPNFMGSMKQLHAKIVSYVYSGTSDNALLIQKLPQCKQEPVVLNHSL